MIGGVLFCRAIQVNFADRRPGDMNLPISILDRNTVWEGIQFSPDLEFIYTLYWQQNKKEFEQNTHCILFSVALFKKKKKSQSSGLEKSLSNYWLCCFSRKPKLIPRWVSMLGISSPHVTVSPGNSILLTSTGTWIHMHIPVHRHTYMWLNIKIEIGL